MLASSIALLASYFCLTNAIPASSPQGNLGARNSDYHPTLSSQSRLAVRNNDQTFRFKAASFNIRFGRPDNITVEQSIANLSSTNPLELPAGYYADMRERPWSERRIPLAEEMLWNDVSLAGKLLLSCLSLESS